MQNKANELRNMEKRDGPYADISNRYREGAIDQFENTALEELGPGLHPLQDTFAHKDEYVREKRGVYHHMHYMEADNPYYPGPRDELSDRYYQTRDASIEYMEEFRRRTGGGVIKDEAF